MQLTKTEFYTIVAIAIIAIVGVYVYFSDAPSVSTDADVRNQISDQAPIPGPATSTSGTTTSQIPTSNQNNKIMNATFQTNKGEFTIEFYGDRTPKTVENFTTLAKAGFYDGVKFHRVIAGFMIQGGDPLSKDDSQSQRWGTGGPGYTFADEITPSNSNEVGTISMANAGPNTNGSQFFINTADNSFLNGKHTVFGKVVSGMEVVKAIEATPVNGSDRPLEAMVIQKIVLK
ncbi:MAG TPA: peptidylprolyl isomerase [Candidatus Paceibacterota bacterium]